MPHRYRAMMSLGQMLTDKSVMYINRVNFIERSFETLKRGRGWERATRGYAAHTILKESFGDRMGVWRMMPRREKRYAMVVSDVNLKEYLEQRTVVLSEVGDALAGIEKVWSAKVPTSLLKAGIVVGFQVHVVPVVRYEGRENDAFNPSEFATRKEAYTEWVEDQFGRMGGKVIGRCKLEYFSLETMTRRNHGRRRQFVQFRKPVAEITGEVQIEDRGSFAEGFFKGMGRHRSFGYGMISLSLEQ